MPKKGFTSLSLNSKIYDYWFDKYQKNKELLKLKGVTSYSSYLIRILTDAKHDMEPSMMFSKISLNDNNLILLDNTLNEEVKLKIGKNKVFCKKDNTSDCIHVGFAYSLPEIYQFLKD